MNIGDLIKVNEHLLILGKVAAPFAIYLGEVKDPLYGCLAKIFLSNGIIRNVHPAHLSSL